MKFDEKTGKKIPENRTEEITVSHEGLENLIKNLGGAFDRRIETAWLLRDINVSLGLIVDMMVLMINRQTKTDGLVNEEEPQPQLHEVEKDDERTE